MTENLVPCESGCVPAGAQDGWAQGLDFTLPLRVGRFPPHGYLYKTPKEFLHFQFHLCHQLLRALVLLTREGGGFSKVAHCPCLSLSGFRSKA
jgi:hypothetical protein